ncbi:MAG: UvrD-helicase domain-containing protein [Bifidobacterium sp.]|uniref:DNA 3'-5' helicase n=1 Tax=Bifidobacterium fermentum TaxID=3059035 RepID=A0AB39UDD5_9BIFI
MTQKKSEEREFRSTAEQQAIIEANIDASQLIVAGAGSGKTMTMTMRIVRLIESGVSPERVLGLTFTRKAASELLTRVSAAVVGHSSSGADAFLKPEVLTYDAFFQGIVRQYGLLVGFNQSTQPLSDAGAYQLAAEVVGANIHGLFAHDEAREHDEDWAAEGFSDERLIRRLAAATPSDGDVASKGFKETVDNVLAIAHACSNSMIGGACTTFEQAARKIHEWDSAFIEQLDSQLEGVEIPDSQISDAKVSPLDAEKKMSEKTRLKKLEQIRHNRELRCAFQADRLRTIARNREILLALAEQYQQAKRHANMAEFSDFTLAAYQLVTRFPSIGAQYRRRFSHVFLDEYQDTSTTQALLIAALFHPDDDAPRNPSDDAIAASHVIDSSAVSAVGDPFQSIYAWRGASPGAFRTFLREFDRHDSSAAAHGSDQGTAMHEYSLSQTFRNGALILEAANNLTLPLRREGGIASSAMLHEVDVKHLRARDGADRGTLGLLATQTLDEEIRGVIDFVKEARRRYGSDSVGTDSSGRVGSGSDIDMHAPHAAILFRSKTNMPQYCDALYDAGLSYEVVGYSALLERPEIRDLRALLDVLCDHTDIESLMRLLATPRFNVNPADLNAFAQMVKGINLESQYRGLVEAGKAPANARRDMIGDYVSEHRDSLPNSVFAIDVLMDDQLESMLRRKGSRIGERGRYLLLQFAEVLRKLQSQAGMGLRAVIRSAIHALQLDIDVILSQSLHGAGGKPDRSSAQASIDAFEGLVDTFEAELQDGTPSTLRGFVAWIDSMGKSPEEPGSNVTGHPDVALMTVHQAKGLEWDAVAIVGMKSGTFPSNQGDGLKITETRPAVIDKFGDIARPAEYVSTARSWMDDATAVPAPIRADADILPRFPHDAEPYSNPLDNLAGITLAGLEDEVYGQCRDDDTVTWLSQQQEYGSRFHADERRLAYVALTRARHDALLSYSASKNAKANGSKVDLSAGSGASNFWIESYQGFAGDVAACHFNDADLSEGQHVAASPASAEGGSDGASAVTGVDVTEVDITGAETGGTAQTNGFECPEFTGYFIGDHAEDYRAALLTGFSSQHFDRGQAMQGDQQPDEPSATNSESSQSSGRSASDALLWPMDLDPAVKSALLGSARLVLANPGARNQTHASSAESGDAEFEGAELDQPLEGTLAAQAMQVMAERSGRLGKLHGNAEDLGALRRSGLQVLSAGGQNVTALQALAGDRNDEGERRYWRGIVRPIPRMPSAAAQAGTQFHEWASAFLSAQDDSTAQQLDGFDGFASIAGEATRRAMLLQLDEQSELPQGEDQRRLMGWKRHLADSRWARRSVAWVERPIVAAIEGRILKGKLDAVFDGGLLEDDLGIRPVDGRDASDRARRYTIVDWKTGRRPRSAEEIRVRLLQLDMYRVLLSMMESVDISGIDACLYYVSEPKPEDREIPAEARSHDEILRDLDAGLPPLSDED